MKISAFYKNATCDVCGEPCVPVARGDRYYHPELKRKIDVSVCYDCDLRLGDLAYEKAGRKYLNFESGSKLKEA